MMKKSLLAGMLVAILAGCSGSDSPSAGDPSQPSRNKHIRGFTYYSDSMQMADQSFVWSQDVFKDYRHMDEDELPKSIKTISSSGCNIPKRLPHQKAHIVHIYSPVHKSPFYTIETERHLVRTAKRYVNDFVRYKGDIPDRKSYVAGERISIANVVVTETDPSILVLISQGNVIWNFHVADNAKLEQVVLLSRKNVGFVNAPASTKIHQLFGDGLKRCKLNTNRWPRKHWAYVEDNTTVSEGVTYVTDDGLQEEFDTAAILYNFLENSYGVKEQDVMGDFRLSSFLIGKALPETKLEFNKLEGSEVFLNSVENLITATNSRFQEISEKMVKDAAEKAAGGDLNKLIGGQS